MVGHILASFLVIVSGGPAPDEGGAAQQFRILVDRYEQGRRDFISAIREAKSDEDGERIIAELRPDEAKFIAKMLELADREPTSRIAAESANWILTHQPFDPDPRAVEIIAKHHVESDAIGPLCLAIWASPRPENGDLLRQISRKNPDPKVRATAAIGLAHFLLYNGNRPDPKDKSADSSRAIAMQAEAVLVLREASRRYPGVVIERATVADTSKIMLDDIEKFGIGRQIGDIEGTDADGRRFKLSDYRGRVVVLTFSGNWCGPCKAMYPDQREIVDRYKDRRFALLSVSTDEKVDTLRRSIEGKEITWRCWWDGGMNGPICQAWGIKQYPTVFVIDPKGIIRYRGVQGDLKKATELLMLELVE